MPDEDDNGTDNDLVMMTKMVEIPCALAQAARQRTRRLLVSRGGVILSKINVIIKIIIMNKCHHQCNFFIKFAHLLVNIIS